MARSRILLSDVEKPPDTHSMAPCAEEETAAAIAALHTRFLRRRRSVAHVHTMANSADRIVCALRRLQNPAVRGYHHGRDIVVSEPFGAIPCVVGRARPAVARAAACAMFDGPPPPGAADVLAAFGAPALRRAGEAGVRISVVEHGASFRDRSKAVAAMIPTIDEWPSPPSGLFVVQERRILLREGPLRMTLAHEFAHAIDAVLAHRPNSYFSYESAELRAHFGKAPAFVNQYAATAPDEYFAESVRAYLEINDSHCVWLPLTRVSLRAHDPGLFDIIEGVFSALATTPQRS